ncbi:MAG: ACP S-malonyltransferase [Deinococcales bacterium]
MSPAPTAEGARLAAVFPGQGSQFVGMARSFYDHSQAAKRVLDEAEEALPGLLALMWEGPAETLKLTANQQPALVAAGAAAFAAYREAGGPAPRYAAGHSLGEYTAHVAAGSLTVSEAVTLVHARGRYMQEAVPEGEGAMAAVMKLDAAAIRNACKHVDGVAEVANLNAPGQTVISGEAAAVAAAVERLKAEGGRVVPLKVSAPFHCSLMQPAAERLRDDLSRVRFEEPAFGIVCNVTADLLPRADEAAGLLTQQVTSPVRWVESVKHLRALGARRFVEFGAGKVLTGLIGRILSDAEAVSVADMDGLRAALEAA